MIKTFKVVLAETRAACLPEDNKELSHPWLCHSIVFVGSIYLWFMDWKFRRRIRRAVRNADRVMHKMGYKGP